MPTLLVGFAVVVIVIVGYLILKGFKPTGVLLFSGMVLLLFTVINGQSILPKNLHSTGNQFTDIFEFVKSVLDSNTGNLGMQIMLICGFASYMTKIGANDALIQQLSRPLSVIKSPYFLLVAIYLLGCLMSFAINSATGLGMIMMATFFPIMVAMGLSRSAAASVCAMPIAIILVPTSSDVVTAAQKSSYALDKFAFNISMPVGFICVAFIAVTIYFWNRYLDKKEKVEQEKIECKPIEVNSPNYYCVLPFLPILGVLLFNGHTLGNINFDLSTTIIASITFSAFVDFITLKGNGKQSLHNLEACYQGMAQAFTSVVMLLVAATVFAQGLIALGVIDGLIHFAEVDGAGGITLMLLLTLITLLAALVTGSGTAAFFALVELVPALATKLGVNPTFFIVPMLQASNLGRIVSPVSGAIVATAGMGNLSPMAIVKRTSVPIFVGFIALIVSTLLLVPS